MIRPLESRHALDMARVHADGFFAPWPIDDFKTYIDDPAKINLGVFQDKRLAGFILGSVHAPEAEILTFVVGRGARGKGRGAALLSAFEREVHRRNCTLVFLEVAEDAEPAKALYHSAGYVRVGRRTAYYRRETGRVDAILMQKRLRG